MRKVYNRVLLICAVAVMLGLVVTAPAAEAFIVVVLPAWLAAIVGYVVVGTAVMVSGYVVYHASSALYYWYIGNAYSKILDRCWNDNKTDFPNIWGSVPPKKPTFDNKCLSNMNTKSTQKFIQKTDGRLIAWNPATEMLTVGETDGKTVVSCHRRPYNQVWKKQQYDPRLGYAPWQRIYPK